MNLGLTNLPRRDALRDRVIRETLVGYPDAHTLPAPVVTAAETVVRAEELVRSGEALWASVPTKTARDAIFRDTLDSQVLSGKFEPMEPLLDVVEQLTNARTRAEGFLAAAQDVAETRRNALHTEIWEAMDPIIVEHLTPPFEAILAEAHELVAGLAGASSAEEVMGSGDVKIINRWQRLAELDKQRGQLHRTWDVFRRGSIALNTTDQGGLFFGFSNGNDLWPAWDRQRGKEAPWADKSGAAWFVWVARSGARPWLPTASMLNEAVDKARQANGLEPMTSAAAFPAGVVSGP